MRYRYPLNTRFFRIFQSVQRLQPVQSLVRISQECGHHARYIGAELWTPCVRYRGFGTLGDLSANVRVATLLALHRSRFELRSGEDVAFRDLRESPTVLIGGFNNSWTMKLTGDLPFIFDRGLTIRDEINNKRVWNPVFLEGGKVAVDYSVVTRMPRSKTGEALISIAGITQSGTRAAAEFITDPKQVKDLVATLPRGWPQGLFTGHHIFMDRRILGGKMAFHVKELTGFFPDNG